MHAVILEQMRCRLNRARGIDLDHFNIVAPRGGNVAKGAAANAAKSVDADLDCHEKSFRGWLLGAL